VDVAPLPWARRDPPGSSRSGGTWPRSGRRPPGSGWRSRPAIIAPAAGDSGYHRGLWRSPRLDCRHHRPHRRRRRRPHRARLILFSACRRERRWNGSGVQRPGQAAGLFRLRAAEEDRLPRVKAMLLGDSRCRWGLFCSSHLEDGPSQPGADPGGLTIAPPRPQPGTVAQRAGGPAPPTPSACASCPFTFLIGLEVGFFAAREPWAPWFSLLFHQPPGGWHVAPTCSGLAFHSAAGSTASAPDPAPVRQADSGGVPGAAGSTSGHGPASRAAGGAPGLADVPLAPSSSTGGLSAVVR
jgi:hypothetical protein